jgi:hypothetical protein
VAESRQSGVHSVGEELRVGKRGVVERVDLNYARVKAKQTE